MAAPLTLVTVVFEAEQDFLRLQARSLARFAADVVDAVVVIDNSRHGMKPRFLSELNGEYGPLISRVRILRPGDVGRVPSTTGWYAQQILKLLVAEQVHTDAYVVLDAKNHLVQPLDASFFVNVDGRLRTSRQDFSGHRLRPDLERTLQYFDVAVEDHLLEFTPTVTPFVLRTDLVMAMVRQVERDVGRPFAAEFLRARLLEFFAYAAWIIARQPPLDAVYVFDQSPSPTVWPRGATEQGLHGAIERSRLGGSPWFSVHRRALGVLEEPALALLAEFWTQAGLFDGLDQAKRFVHAAQQRVRRGERRQRVLDVAPRSARLVRRLLGRAGSRIAPLLGPRP